MRVFENIAPSGSRPKTIPRTTLLPARLPPIILTTRTLSTLKLFRFGGMTERAASATNEANMSSDPYCFDAIAGLSASVRDGWVNGVERVCTERAWKRGVNTLQRTLGVKRTFELGQGLDAGQLVALDDFAGVQTHHEQRPCLFQKLARQNQDEVGSVAHLRHVRHTGKQPKPQSRTSDSCAWLAMTSSFAAGWTTSISRMMVAASEVTNIRPRWLIISLFRPAGGKHEALATDIRTGTGGTHRLARNWCERGLKVRLPPECCARRHPRGLAIAGNGLGMLDEGMQRRPCLRTLYPSLNS